MGVLILVPELHGDLITIECEEFFAESVRFLLLPFRGQKGDDLLGAFDEQVAVTPDAVGRIAFGYLLCLGSVGVGVGVREVR
jgi:hypothetical protein